MSTEIRRIEQRLTSCETPARVTGALTERCSGRGWFYVEAPPQPARRLCAPCAAAALRADKHARSTPIALQCARCGHIGSSTEGGREFCNRCGAEFSAPR